MKNKNKIVSVLLVLFVIIVVVGIVWYKLATRQVYIPDIPNSYNLSSISYELESGIVTVSEVEKMDKIIEGFYALDLKTKSVSVQEYPVNVENIVAIRFNYREDSVGSFYLYKKNGNYFMEEPYNGIYRLTDEEYNYIIDLVKE